MSHLNRVVVIILAVTCFIPFGGVVRAERLLASARARNYVYGIETNDFINGRGTVIKRGDGTLVYRNESMFRGAVRVEAGSVVVGTASDNRLTVLPDVSTASLTNGLLLWMDASSNVASEAGAVSRWFDVRDADVLSEGGAAETNFPWAEVAEGATPPTEESGAAGQTGVDFGAENSGIWLQWADSATNALQFTNICSVVMALSCTNGGGCFLGDAVTSHFARGSASAEGSRFLWRFGTSAPVLIQGDAFVDEACVDTLKATPKEGDQILAFIARKTSGDTNLFGVAASNFGKDRDVETGGFRLYEVLVYNRILTETERITISDYLDSKWFGRSIMGDLHVCSGCSAQITSDEGHTLFSDLVDGGGTVTKTGAGAWVFDNCETSFSGALQLQEGSVSNASTVWRSVPFTVGTGTLSVAANARSWSVADAPTEGVVEKNGSGEWMVSGLPRTGMQTLRINAGVLRLTPRETVLPVDEAEGSETIFEDSFEFPFDQLSYSSMNSGAKYSPGVYGDGWIAWPETGWACQVNDPNTGTPRNPAVVLCNDGYNASLVVSGGAGQGDQALLLSGKGEIKRPIVFPDTGNYMLSFWAAARNTSICYNHNFEVCLDDVSLTNVLTQSSTPFRCYQVSLTNVTAGTHELRFSGLNSLAPTETYRASVLDAIRICSLVADGSLSVPDSGLESGDWSSTATVAAPKNTVWQFGPAAGWTMALTAWSQMLGKNGAPEGGKAAWFRNTDFFASTNLIFGQTGTYRLSFLASARQTSDDGTGEALTKCWPGHDYRVFINDLACGYGRTMDRRFERQEMLFDIPAPGTYSLRFIGLNEADLQYFSGLSAYDNNRASLIDSVAVHKVDAIFISDYSFESNSTAYWTGVNNPLPTAAGNNYVSQNNVPSGSRAGILTAAGQFYQNIVFPQDGVYQLSFYAAGRFLYNGGLDPTRTTASVRQGHDFRVCVDSDTVIKVQTRDEIFRRYTVRLPMLRAGEHRLSFEGINTLGGNNRVSAIDVVRLTALSTESADSLLPSDTAVEIAQGAKLFLDYIGTNSVRMVKLGAFEPSGLITSERFPAYIQGTGALYTPSKGTLIFVF